MSPPTGRLPVAGQRAASRPARYECHRGAPGGGPIGGSPTGGLPAPLPTGAPGGGVYNGWPCWTFFWDGSLPDVSPLYAVGPQPDRPAASAAKSATAVSAVIKARIVSLPPSTG